MKENPGVKFSDGLYKQRQFNYTLIGIIPKAVLLIVLLYAGMYFTFSPQELDTPIDRVQPSSKFHIDYGTKISALLDVKLPDYVHGYEV